MEEFREHFSPFFRDFAVERVHRLVREVERQPEYLKRREDVEDMGQVEHIQLNESEKELFIYLVRSADEPIREDGYRAGLADGIRCAEWFRRLQRD